MWLILLFTAFAYGQENCFDQSDLPAFLRLQNEIPQSSAKQLQATRDACYEIKFPEKTYQSEKDRHHLLDRITGFVTRGVFGQASGAFALMNSTDAEREFKTQLQAIKQNPNRWERIRAVHDLVVETLGPYNHELTALQDAKNSLQPAHPGAVLRLVEKGQGGICRHHVALLSWSLLQVARPTSETKTLSLTENSFSSKVMDACNADGCHTWVRLNIPFQTENGLRFENVDLDTTWYKTPTLIHSRLNGFSQSSQESLLKACEVVTSCLATQVGLDAAKSLNIDRTPQNKKAPRYYREAP